MIRRTAYTLIHIGLWLRHLQWGQHLKRESALKGLGILRSGFDDAAFFVSAKGLDKLTALEAEIAALPETAVVGATLGTRLKQLIQILEEVTFAEAQTKHYFVVPDRRYNSKYLLDEPERLLKDGVYSRMSELAQYDFAEGCRCIAFGRPTAAAFHVLRATENAIKQLYLRKVRRNRLKKPMWAAMVDELRQRKRDSVPTVLLASLDMIRTSYRNPTAHPEATYTLDESEDLLGLCIDVINKIDAVVDAA